MDPELLKLSNAEIFGKSEAVIFKGNLTAKNQQAAAGVNLELNGVESGTFRDFAFVLRTFDSTFPPLNYL